MAPEESHRWQAAGSNAHTGPEETPEISIIVVSYNTREMTLACLRSVRAETSAAHQLIVWDNASADGSAEAIAAEFPDIELVASAENLGFAAANNAAAKQAHAPLLLLLNPDTVVLDGAIDRLLDFTKSRKDAGIWGGRTVFGDMSPNAKSCWGDMTLWSLACQAAGLDRIFPASGLFNPEAYGGWDRMAVREVDIVSGCLLLVRRSLWEDLGGFDLSYLMYGEDADLCRRARDLGARPAVTPNAVIVHHGGASEPVRADKHVRLLRAKMTLVRRHFHGWRKPAGIVLFHGWPWNRYLMNRVALALLRRDHLRANAASWREVIARRAEWREGYPDQRRAPR